jgi:hypothetical protein
VELTFRLERLISLLGGGEPMMTSDDKRPHFPEFNYCQIKEHYIYDEKLQRYFHKTSTPELMACIQAHFEVR